MEIFAAICMIGVVCGVVASAFSAYISGLRNRPIESWVHSWGFVALLIAEAGAVILSFAWNAWRGNATLWWSQWLSLLVFFLIAGIAMMVRSVGEDEYSDAQKKLKEEQEERNRQARKS